MKNNENFKGNDNRISKEKISFDMSDLISLVKEKQSIKQKSKIIKGIKQSISEGENDNNNLKMLLEEEENIKIERNENSKKHELSEVKKIEKELNSLFIDLVKNKREEEQIKETIDVLRQNLLRIKGLDEEYFKENFNKDKMEMLYKDIKINDENKENKENKNKKHNEYIEIDSIDQIQKIEEFFRLNKLNVENEGDIDLYLINNNMLSIKDFLRREKLLLEKYITASVAIMSSLGVGFLITGNMLGLGVLVLSVTLFLMLRLWVFRKNKWKIFNMIRKYHDVLRLYECFNIDYEKLEINFK